MEFFEASGNWVVTLGKTLVHSLWIGLLLLSILKIILQLIPGKYSNIRYRIATVSLLIFLGAVVTLFLHLFDPLKSQTNAIHVTQKLTHLIPVIQDLSNNIGRSPVEIISTLCSYIYSAGVLIMLIRSIISLRQIRGLKRSGLPIRGEWYDRFIQIKFSILPHRKVSLLESDRIEVPSVIGLLKPAILVPAGMFTHLSPDQVETILMHELYHLRRLDFLVNLIQLVVEALFFYNPAVRIISQMIRTERENCCDDRVVLSCGDPLAYARALLKLAEHHPLFNTLVPGALGTEQYQLLNRIKRILNQSNMKTNIREKFVSLLIMAGGMIILLTVSGFSSGFSIVKNHDSREVPAASFVTPLPEPHPIDSPRGIQPVVPDTIPGPESNQPEKIDDPEVLSEMEQALKELEEIDWEEIKKEMENAKLEVLEEIDWEEIKKEMEDAKLEVLEEIDWEEIKKEMEDAKLEVLEEIDWEEIKKEMEQALKELEEIDWEQLKQEIEDVSNDIQPLEQR
ncbi:MAG: M56 family metallopeptidase [Bacteroidota bacterium]